MIKDDKYFLQLNIIFIAKMSLESQNTDLGRNANA